MDWSDIALPVGSPEERQFGIHLNFTLPDLSCDVPATDRQIDAVKLFYQTDFGELCDGQAHALLSCREYARLCSEALLRQYPKNLRDLMVRAIAAFVLSDETMVRFLTTWNSRNFERGTGSPRVRGTPYFIDVEQFVSYLEGMIEMNGWTMAALKRLRVVD